MFAAQITESHVNFNYLIIGDPEIKLRLIEICLLNDMSSASNLFYSLQTHDLNLLNAIVSYVRNLCCVWGLV